MMILSVAACGDNSDNDGKEDDNKQNQEQDNEQDNQQNDETDKEIAVDEYAGTELTIVVMQHASDKVGNYDEKPIVVKAEEATGIHINWIVMDSSVAGERVNTMLASEEQPDAYMSCIGTDTISRDMEMFYDISGLLETYAPDVYDDYVNGGQNVLDMLTLSDGSIRSLAGNVGTEWSPEASGMWYINKAWLDQLGKEVPATADELYDVLCAFRDNDMNGNGDTTDELPITFCESEWSACFMNFANAVDLSVAFTSLFLLSFRFVLSI